MRQTSESTKRRERESSKRSQTDRSLDRVYNELFAIRTLLEQIASKP